MAMAVGDTTTEAVVQVPRPVLPERPSVDLSGLARDRQRQLRTVLTELDLDGLVLFTAPAVQYATGYRSVGADIYAGHQMAAVLTEGDCWLVCPAGDAAAAGDAGVPLDRIIPFGTFFFESQDESSLTSNVNLHPNLDAALAYVIGDLAVTNARWGVDDLRRQHALGTRVDLINANSAVERVRALKLGGEIELVRYAALLTEAAMASAVRNVSEGATEQEVAEHVAGVMVAGGGMPRFVVVGTGPRSALSDSFASSRAWRKGELLRFDVGCVVDGYWSDLGRTVVLDEPTQVQTNRYQAILAGEQAAFDILKPGVTGRELFEVAVRTVNSKGLPYRRHHCGHGIGLSIYETPSISPSGDSPLEAGTTLNLETPYYELGWAGMMVEDTLLVTDSGYETLNVTDRRLWVANS